MIETDREEESLLFQRVEKGRTLLLHQKVNITQWVFMCFRLRTMALGTVENGFIRLVSNQGETLTLSAWSLTQPYAPFFATS